MSKIIKLRFALLLLCSIAIGNLSYAQTYCHSETNTPFNFLTSPTTLSADSAWDDNSYLLPIGFDFLFQGILYDTLTVESNGKVYFSNILGGNDDPTITAFGGETNLADMIDRGTYMDTSLSPISYKLFETPTDTFLVIEYKNIGFYKDQPLLADSISFQLKLYRENGKIEVHIGPHKIIDTNSFYTTGPVIGLGNHFEDNGYFLTGDPVNPSVEKYINVLDTIPDEGMLYTFNPVLPNPTISILSNPLDGCFDPATSYTFTATAINESSPSLQWEKNGVPLSGENGLVYNAGLMNKDDSITIVMTLSAACPSALPITSNRIVVSRPVASIFISASDTTICSGDSILFTANVVNEGNNPIYKWIKNSDTLTTTNPEFMALGLSDQDTVKCLLISNERCVAVSQVSADSIVVTVLPVAIPLLSITASKDSICTGDSVLYTAIPSFGGPTPIYNWKRNGAAIGGNSSTIYATNLNDLDTIQCEMVSSLPCANGIAVSNEHIIKVRSYVMASVSIAADLTEICSGQTITFTASPLNGGITPVYIWKNNGLTSGANNVLYAANNFNDGDSITCVMSSSLFCSNTDTSGFVKLIVHPIITPTVSIVADKDSICVGQSLFFTATPLNGGTANYQWKLNGNDAGTNSPFFSSTTFNNNDAVSCVMSSNLNCLSSPTVPSNSILAKVISYVNAGITIVSDANTVCTTTTANFTASSSNGGTIPVYEWKKNGTAVGSNSNSYSASGFNNSDQMTCTLTSNLFCVNGSPVTSNLIVMNVISGPTSTITIAPSQNPICTGGNITFNATVAGTTSPVFQWQLNNVNVGINNASFTASGFANTDEVLCKILNSVDCAGGLPTSNIIQVLVNSSADPLITIAPDKNSLCEEDTVTYSAVITGAGINPVYEWKKNSIIVGGNSPDYTIIQPNNGDLIICTVTSAANCTAISNTISATVSTCLGTEDAVDINGPKIYPNPFEDNLSITFQTNENTTLTLLDVAGKELRKEVITPNKEYNAEWILTDLHSGIYLLKIAGEKEITIRKIVKQ